MGEFGQSTARATPTDTTATGSLPLKPATYVVDTTDVPPAAATAPAPNTTASDFPNINQVPAGPKSKLLTPDQKAKVIADLEALAKSQEAAVEKSRKQSATQCDDAVKNALNPEAKLKSEAAGQGC
jgi:hypothetical protein